MRYLKHLLAQQVFFFNCANVLVKHEFRARARLRPSARCCIVRDTRQFTAEVKVKTTLASGTVPLAIVRDASRETLLVS